MNTLLKNKLNALFKNKVSLSSEGLKLISTSNSGATHLDLVQVNIHFRNKLSLDYVDFLKHFDGCELFNCDNLGGLKFLGTKEIIQENEIVKKDFGEYWPDDIIIFCVCLGEGNYLGFKALENYKYEIIDCFHEEIPANWNVIGDSLDKFIEKLIDLKGEEFWLVMPD